MENPAAQEGDYKALNSVHIKAQRQQQTEVIAGIKEMQVLRC